MTELEKLRRHADRLRLDVVTMIHDVGDGHPGPALSIADIVAALYFNILRIDPRNPDWEDRDRFIISKGHACPVLYAALARRGFFSTDAYASLRRMNGMLQGHPSMGSTPGVDMTSGSLGNGLGIAVGIATAAKYMGKGFRTYVIMGDGEVQEGAIWEAAAYAKHQCLDNLTAFLDNNGFQSTGRVEDVSGIYPLAEKWKAFGWHVIGIDGHDHGQILAAAREAGEHSGQPSIIIARTIKGKGLPYMENDNSWHKRIPDDEQLRIAREIFKEVEC